MTVSRPLLVLLSLFLAPAAVAEAKPVCTVVADAASGRILVEEGDCRTRVTPASTFKVALAVMGFDAGVLTDGNSPTLTIEPGEPDWGGDAWKRPTGPGDWMKHSVVWYSQRIARALGEERLARYATAFGYGNADFSGDPGKNNGLERAWIGSSLRISPVEQVLFLRRLVRGDLPVAPGTAELARSLVERRRAADGWTIRGKTGSAFPRRADGSLDRARGWGWYVGWASLGERQLVFARLNQDEKSGQGRAGLRARDDLLAAWPGLARAASR